MALTDEFVDQFARAMIRVEALLTQATRLVLENPEMSDRHFAEAKAVAEEWGMHPALRHTLAELAVENVYCGR